MATSITLLSWNVRALGEARVNRALASDLIALICNTANPDIITIQELVYSHAPAVASLLRRALVEVSGASWNSMAIQAQPGGRDRDGYLFLWRDTVKPQQLGGKAVWGRFSGDWPSNRAESGGRQPGYLGFTLADGTHPFLVASYHAPPLKADNRGAGPALALLAITAEAAQLRQFPDGSATPYEARFFCADFNLPFVADNQANFYGPALAATATENATAANTVMVASARDARGVLRANSAACYSRNLDNILAGPAGRMTNRQVLDTINLIETNASLRQVAEAALYFHDETDVAWGDGALEAAFAVARTHLSDHLPVVATFTLVP